MKLHTPDNVIEIQGSTEESSDFTVALNSKAFRVLSSSLYKDKIGSIVREICSNASDAHVAGGNPDQPFEVHLPSALEPWFSVKDYGIGMSKEDVKSVYTSYFTSTKDKDNTQLGGFGIGGKSPFSYTDQFTITSTKGGITSVHSAYLKACGTPSIIEMHSQASDEHSGTEIKMSVKSEDYQAFADAAKTQLAFFKVKPIFDNAPYGFSVIDEFEDSKIAFQGSFFKVAKDYPSISIVQGNVGYPLDITLIQQDVKEPNLKEFIYNLGRNYKTAIYFSIGEISVTASREGLEYTKETISNILGKIQEVKSEIEDCILEKVKTATTNWEIAGILTEFGRISNITDSKINWFSDSNVPDSTVLGYSFHSDHKLTYAQYSSWTNAVKTYAHGRVNAGSIAAIYYTDAGCKYVKHRIKAAAMLGGTAYITAESDVPAVRKALGGFNNFIALSTVEYTPVKRKSSSTSPKAEFYSIEYSNSITLDKETEDLEDYIDGEAFICFVQYRKSLNTEDIARINKLKLLKSYDVDIPCVIAMSEKEAIKTKAKYSNCLDADHFIESERRKIQGRINLRNSRIAMMEGLLSISTRFLSDEFNGTLLNRLCKLRQKYGTNCSKDAWSTSTGSYALNKVKQITNKVKEENPILSIDYWGLSDKQLLRYIK